MKLYTEDQMKRCFNDAQMQWANNSFIYQNYEEYKIACNPIPIELPSDDEIYFYSNALYPDFVYGVEGAIIRKLAHSNGAKWILEQIKK